MVNLTPQHTGDCILAGLESRWPPAINVREEPLKPHVTLSPTEVGSRPVVVVGDVHGCLAELRDFVTRETQRHPDCLFIFCGDIINKGPNSLECLRYLRNMGAGRALCVRGNHEVKIIQLWIQWKTHRNTTDILGKFQWMKSLSCEDVRWMRELPYTISVPSLNAIIVHAGLIPGVPLEKQDTWDMTEMLDLVEGPDGALKPRGEAGGQPWAARWHGPQHVYYGHAAERGLQRYPYATGLDTGCVLGKRLTGVYLTGADGLVTVEAKAAYRNKPPKVVSGGNGQKEEDKKHVKRIDTINVVQDYKVQERESINGVKERHLSGGHLQDAKLGRDRHPSGGGIQDGKRFNHVKECVKLNGVVDREGFGVTAKGLRAHKERDLNAGKDKELGKLADAEMNALIRMNARSLNGMKKRELNGFAVHKLKDCGLNAVKEWELKKVKDQELNGITRRVKEVELSSKSTEEIRVPSSDVSTSLIGEFPVEPCAEAQTVAGSCVPNGQKLVVREIPKPYSEVLIPSYTDKFIVAKSQEQQWS